MIQEKLNKGIIRFIKMQMILSQFIDGEEAESFFEDLEYYHKLNPENFCKAYSFLEKKYGKEKFKKLRILKIECLKN